PAIVTADRSPAGATNVASQPRHSSVVSVVDPGLTGTDRSPTGRREPLVKRDDGDQMVRVRVLIVEDDPRVRTAMRSFLSDSDGFDVVGDAGNATAALEIARKLGPVVALVDVLLPGTE